MSKTIYFLGIGGIGMSALARYFLRQGDQVYGYDLVATPLTAALAAEGAQIHYEEDVRAIPHHVDRVVYTPAISKLHAEYQFFIKNNIPIYKRSEVLGELLRDYPTYAVAGTHGKTTTTAMLAHLFHPCRKLLAFIGGIAKNFNANCFISDAFDTAVVEADEFDRSFLTLHPTIAVITSMDADHLDIYKDVAHLQDSFQRFANQVAGDLVIHERVAAQIAHPRKWVYGSGEECDFRIESCHAHGHSSTFSLLCPQGQRLEITIPTPGEHNVWNAAAAAAVALMAGLTPEVIAQQLSTFQGVKRRFDYQIDREDRVFIDDYAHHPAELKSIISAVKQIYPDKPLTVVFQPHLYSRTRDFATEFAEVLALADELILLDIYPAREEPIEGITSSYLLNLIKNNNKYLLSKPELLLHIQERKPQLLLTVGAGDIDKMVEEIKDILI